MAAPAASTCGFGIVNREAARQGNGQGHTDHKDNLDQNRGQTPVRPAKFPGNGAQDTGNRLASSEALARAAELQKLLRCCAATNATRPR
jgi:hypothetical protein